MAVLFQIGLQGLGFEDVQFSLLQPGVRRGMGNDTTKPHELVFTPNMGSFNV
jgi:hypothetical protein